MSESLTENQIKQRARRARQKRARERRIAEEVERLAEETRLKVDVEATNRLEEETRQSLQLAQQLIEEDLEAYPSLATAAQAKSKPKKGKNEKVGNLVRKFDDLAQGERVDSYSVSSTDRGTGQLKKKR